MCSWSFPGFFPSVSACLELPNPCPCLCPAEGGKRRGREVSQCICYIRAQSNSSWIPAERGSLPTEFPGVCSWDVELGVAPSRLSLFPPVSHPTPFPWLSTTGSSINPVSRSSDRYPAVNEAQLKLGSISCLLLFPIMQTPPWPFPSCLLSQLSEALPRDVSCGTVKNVTANFGFCFFVLHSAFTPGLIENDVKHQQWFMEVRQFLAPWAMEKVNRKLFSHSKWLYPALEEAAKTARGRMNEKERLGGYLWISIFEAKPLCWTPGADFSREFPWMRGFPAPHLPHQTGATSAAGAGAGAGWKCLN